MQRSLRAERPFLAEHLSPKRHYPRCRGDIPALQSSLPWCMIQKVAGPTEPRLSTSQDQLTVCAYWHLVQFANL